VVFGLVLLVCFARALVRACVVCRFFGDLREFLVYFGMCRCFGDFYGVFFILVYFGAIWRILVCFLHFRGCLGLV